MHNITQIPPAAIRNASSRRIALWCTFLVLTFAAVVADAITLTAVQSRKVHGANPYDLSIDTTQPIGGAVTVEPRAIGTGGHQIVFQFDTAITLGTPGTATAVDETGATVAAAITPASDNKEVIVVLTGVPDNKRVKVSLKNVNNAGLDVEASLGFLVGDVSNSRDVSAADVSQLKSRAGQGVDTANSRFDLNATGLITAADISAVKSRVPRALPDAYVAPAFTTQPVNATITAGQTAQFVAAVSGTPAPTLQWQSSTDGGANWRDILGAISSPLNIVGALGDNGRQYRAVATNSVNTATSNAATLTVNAAAIAPAFDIQPGNVAITEGQSAQFAVAAIGAPTPTLQWQVSTDGGVTWNNVLGETGSVLNIVAVALANNGKQFRAVATNGSGSVNSNAGTLTVSVSPKAMIGPAGGTLDGYFGAQIIVPAGALAGTVEIGLARDSTNSPAFALPDIEAVGATYELTPHGTAFLSPVTLRIPFNPARLPDDAIPVLYKAETGGSFTALPTTIDGNFLVAAVANFSWVLAVYDSSGSSGVPGSTKPRAVYALRPGSSVASYRINATTGALTGPTSTALTGADPTSVVAHPSRRFIYVTHAGGTTVNGIAPNSVATYPLNTLNGQVAGAAKGSVSTGAPAGYISTMPAVHPSGKFLYVMNFDVASINPAGFISLFTIDGVTGALTATASISGNGVQPLGIAFNRLGTFAYVLYGGSSSTNSFSTQVKVYSVNATTGALTGPLSGVAAGVLGSGARSIVVDANGKFAYVATLFTDEVIAYSINSTTGALTNIGSTVVTAGSKLASLATDSYGRFLHAGRQQPWLSKNLLSYQINATNGSLAPASTVLTACSGGGCVGPVAVVAEPQGQFVYAIDSAVAPTLSAFSVSAATGALTATGSPISILTPRTPGVSYPITFGVTGVSPAWQNNCTFNCALPSTGGGSGGGGGGPNPNPPTSHYLTVTQGAFVGYVYSTTPGIDIGPATIAYPIPKSDFRAPFPVNSSVLLCTMPPPQPSGPYYVEWTGSCSGTGICTSVTMASDKDCHVEFKKVI